MSSVEKDVPFCFFTAGGALMRFFPPFFSDFSASHKVTAIDFPGFGLSDEPMQVWGVPEYTMMLEALCGHLGIKKPGIVCHSFGGRVAIMFASRNEADRMIFVDAAGIKPHRGAKYHLRVLSYKLCKWWLLKVCGDEEKFRKMRSSRGSADYRNSSDMMKAILSRVVSQDLREYLPCIKSPVLLFWGENDTATPLRDARIMEKMLPDAGIVLVKGGSHFSFLDDPALFRSMIRTFLI